MPGAVDQQGEGCVPKPAQPQAGTVLFGCGNTIKVQLEKDTQSVWSIGSIINVIG